MKRKSLVVLTGAGISAESGIKTFRDSGGLWENHRIEDVASPEGFYRNPSLVQHFYNLRRAQLKEVKPNAAHVALARLEREWPGDFLLVTQNVDDLHERAGSKHLIHMHGELLRARCLESGTDQDWAIEIDTNSKCGCCGLTGTLRPHIVWFGEMPLQMETIYATLAECDLFIAIGTSGQVYPAAGFASEVAGKARTIEVSFDETQVSQVFEEHRRGLASHEVPRLVDELLSL